MTEVCHVDAKLMRATRLWVQAQEREAVVYLQSLVLREALKPVRAHAAADDGALRAANRRVDDAARWFNSADGNSAVLAPQIA